MSQFPGRTHPLIGGAADSVKILILKPSSLGDVVQALPVLRLLKLHWPQSRVWWWIESGLAPLLEGDPDLAGIVRFERDRSASPRHWGGLWRSVQSVRAQRFDLVIDLQCLARSAAFGWLANGRRLVGLDEPREAARGFYDVVVRRASFHTHAVDWYLSVLPVLGIPADRPFDWLPRRPAVAEEISRKWQGNNRRWIAVQPGARWPTKRWPLEAYREVIRALLQEYPDLHFAILGGQEDVALGQALAAVEPSRCLDLAGRTSLPEMVEWLRAASLMLTNDSGPMHVAAALGKPVVALFGPTEPRRTGPYGQLGAVLQLELPCSPCFSTRCVNPRQLACLRDLSPATVLEAVRRRLSQPASSGGSHQRRSLSGSSSLVSCGSAELINQ